MNKKKVLVVYYSLQGFTEEIAKTIKEITNGDLHKIELEKPYSLASSYTLGLLHAQTNHAPKLKNTPLNFEDYDLIFVGAPIWWFTLTPPIRSFLKENNLNNKKIVPFCTHKGNFGNYFEKFKEEYPEAHVFEEADFFNNKKAEKPELLKDVKSFVNRAEALV